MLMLMCMHCFVYATMFYFDAYPSFAEFDFQVCINKRYETGDEGVLIKWFMFDS